MGDQANSITALRDDYRQRRDLANFYQGQITALNAAPIQVWSTVALFVSIAGLSISTAGVLTFWQKVWIVLGALATGVGLAAWSKYKHGREAEVIRTRYLAEHALLFPGIPPIELVGFLLEGRHIS
jgi:hypothetical protein